MTTDTSVTTRISRGTREWLYIVLVLLFALVVISPLLQPGYFWGAHDARHDVYFIFQYDQSVQDGIWFPRWAPDWTFGYGYPFFIVYGPLATFVGELFHHFLGLGFEASVKAVLALSIVLSGLAMYGFVRSWLGRNAGLVARWPTWSSPITWSTSMCAPRWPSRWRWRSCRWRCGAFARLCAARAWPRSSGAALAYAAIMWTSNLVALVFTPALAVYVAVLIFWHGAGSRTRASDDAAQSRLRPTLRSVVRLSLAPAARVRARPGARARHSSSPRWSSRRYINRTQWFGEYYDPTQHFVYFNQLFNPAWGFGISQPGPDDVAQGEPELPAGRGRDAAFADRAGHRPGRLPAIACRARALVLGRSGLAVSIFLTLGISALAWRYVPLVPYAQFPWRYLMLAILPLSILPGALVADGGWRADGGWHDCKRQSAASHCWPAFVLALLLLLSSSPYLRVEMREPTLEQGPVSYAALMRFQRTSDEMTGVTAWVDPAAAAATGPTWPTCGCRARR